MKKIIKVLELNLLHGCQDDEIHSKEICIQHVTNVTSNSRKMFLSRNKLLPGHLNPPLHAVDGLLEVAQQPVDVAPLAVRRGGGLGLAQVVGYHQSFFKADLPSQEHY